MRKTVHFPVISYALKEICSAEEAYSLIHLALDDTHHADSGTLLDPA